MVSTTTVPKATVATAISVRDLSLGVQGGDLILKDVDFDLTPGRILALVGESGSGKTTAALACMNHLRTGLELRGGSVQLHEGASRFFNQNMDLLTLSEKQVRKLRGGTIAYVPQDPALSLNGALRVGEQIHEVLRIHEFGRNGREREARVAEVLEEVGLPSTKKYQRRYPHQLSGGQQQRIGIAMAFACRPAVIILDEPTTGLDVATQDLVLKTVYQLTTKHDVAASTSPTTSRWSPRSPTTWRSCSAARSSNAARPTRCFTIPITSTPRRSWPRSRTSKANVPWEAAPR